LIDTVRGNLGTLAQNANHAMGEERSFDLRQMLRYYDGKISVQQDALQAEVTDLAQQIFGA